MSRRSCWLPVVLLLAVALALPREARAKGMFDGDADAVPIGEWQPGELYAFCLPWTALSMLHLGAGAAALLGQSSPMEPATRTIGLFEVGMGFQLTWNRDGRPTTPGFQLIPRLGYTLESGRGQLAHLGHVGIALGYGNIWATIAYAPSLVMGANDGQLRFGLRHGIVTYFLYGLGALEMSHQSLFNGDNFENDLRIILNANLILVAYALGHAR